MISRPFPLRLLWALLAAALWLPLPAAAAPAAEQKLRESVDAVLDVLYAGTGGPVDPDTRQDELKRVLMQRFSFDEIARRALGPNWRQLSADQQREFTDLFASLLIRTYSRRFGATARPEVAWGTPRDLGNDRLEVPSTVSVNGQPFSVTYRLNQRGGDWQAYDVIIEGVSLVANYRKQFDATLNRSGPDALLGQMRNMLQP